MRRWSSLDYARKIARLKSVPLDVTSVFGSGKALCECKMDFTMPIAGVGGLLHQHVSLPVLWRSPPAAVERSSTLARTFEEPSRLKSTERGSRKKPTKRCPLVYSPAAHWRRGQTSVACCSLVNAFGASGHVDGNRHSSQPVFTAVFTCMFCIHGCASSLAKQWQRWGTCSSCAHIIQAPYTLPAHTSRLVWPVLAAAAGSKQAGVARRNRQAGGKRRVRVEMFNQTTTSLGHKSHLDIYTYSSPPGAVCRCTNNTITTSPSLLPSPARRSVVLTPPSSTAPGHCILCAHPSRVSSPHPSPTAYFFSITLIARVSQLLRTIQDSLRYQLKPISRSNASPLAAGGGALHH